MYDQLDWVLYIEINSCVWGSRTPTDTCADPEGGGGQDPLENHKLYGIL